MSGGWTLEWQSGESYGVMNRTGQNAENVTFSAHGPMVCGGRRNWTETVDVVPNDKGIRRVFVAAWGAAANPPYISVEWTDADGYVLSQHLPIPRR